MTAAAERPTCAGVKGDGTPCKSTALNPDNGYCTAHQDQAAPPAPAAAEAEAARADAILAEDVEVLEQELAGEREKVATLERRVAELEAVVAAQPTELELEGEEGELEPLAVGVHVVTAGELARHRAAGVVLGNAAGDAILDRDPNAQHHDAGDLIVVSTVAGADTVAALREAARKLGPALYPCSTHAPGECPPDREDCHT